MIFSGREWHGGFPPSFAGRSHGNGGVHPMSEIAHQKYAVRIGSLADERLIQHGGGWCFSFSSSSGLWLCFHERLSTASVDIIRRGSTVHRCSGLLSLGQNCVSEVGLSLSWCKANAERQQETFRLHDHVGEAFYSLNNLNCGMPARERRRLNSEEISHRCSGFASTREVMRILSRLRRVIPL